MPYCEPRPPNRSSRRLSMRRLFLLPQRLQKHPLSPLPPCLLPPHPLSSAGYHVPKAMPVPRARAVPHATKEEGAVADAPADCRRVGCGSAGRDNCDAGGAREDGRRRRDTAIAQDEPVKSEADAEPAKEESAVDAVLEAPAAADTSTETADTDEVFVTPAEERASFVGSRRRRLRAQTLQTVLVLDVEPIVEAIPVIKLLGLRRRHKRRMSPSRRRRRQRWRKRRTSSRRLHLRSPTHPCPAPPLTEPMSAGVSEGDITSAAARGEFDDDEREEAEQEREAQEPEEERWERQQELERKQQQAEEEPQQQEVQEERDEEAEEEAARKQRVAERMAKMGGFNPFGARLYSASTGRPGLEWCWGNIFQGIGSTTCGGSRTLNKKLGHWGEKVIAL
ncbi:hypothetical protein B0H14DRAFT_3482810 [Mycena olivaceomarginata]|nr:hypothetical protein B0H14DRAFT_3482810 [Mycena olivaceomarginata]